MDLTVIGQAIFSWFVSTFLGRLFFPNGQNQEIIRAYEDRIEKKDESIRRLTREQQRRQREKRRIVEALKRSGLSTEKLIAKYGKPLNAILISYSTQVERAKSGYYEPCKFVLDELKKLGAKGLGGSDCLIPPARVPKWVKGSDDLRLWFETEILKGRHCKLKFAVLFDLRQRAFWNTYLPYRQKQPWNFTIGEVLDVDDLFTEEGVNTIALGDVIRDGDVAWLASCLLSGTELEVIHKNQSFVESQLGNPSLRTLSDDRIAPELSAVMAGLGIADPEEVSRTTVKEAKFWRARLG